VHCINRCVRRCFLCGDDPITGRNFDHRKRWLEERLAFLARQFGIDVLGFAILSNHFHLVLRNRPDVVATWSDTEVAARWLALCPLRRTRIGEPSPPTEAELDTIRNVPSRLAELRRRLSDISWFMRLIAEPIARRANREDETSGRFWQGRFKAVRLCDEAAILACAVYVDLNPIRAGLARTPETSNFTSVQRRIQSLRQHAARSAAASRADSWLSPVPLGESQKRPGPQADSSGRRASDKGFLPVSVEEYLALVDWTGRQIVRGKCGAIPPHLPPLLERTGIAAENWLPLVTRFGRLFHRVAGAPHSIDRLTHGTNRLHRGRATLLTR
jgi:REP element-mobilizing transposase RayT